MFGKREACPALVNGSIPARRPGGSVAEGRYLADEETIHYGIIPRTNRGVFAINELPDLTEKVQVGLFNLMEEKDVQIKLSRRRYCPSGSVPMTTTPKRGQGVP